jgi:hypothetical protein
MFAQGAFAFPLNSYNDYRPGNRFTLDAGVRYEVTPAFALLLQLNALWRGRDSGQQADAEDSGGRYLFVSPGVSFQVTHSVQLFGIVQLPIYQYVNGVQLTANCGRDRRDRCSVLRRVAASHSGFGPEKLRTRFARAPAACMRSAKSEPASTRRTPIPM